MKRNKIQIIQSILNTCFKETKITKLIQKSNLDYRSTVKYLSLLTKNGAIIKIGNLYHTTNKGRIIHNDIQSFYNQILWD
jgi:predicted transcriptional regulator